ncbi:MAG TPA: argininosuccinate lyase [Armatimonadota bacterium]|nr:argininosuccinate lyase [Armatimonadota bacterium]
MTDLPKNTGAHTSAKLWGGRFAGGVEAALHQFQASLPFDARMWREDITASIAHARMLGATGIITAEDADGLIAGLQALLAAWEPDGPEIDAQEDIHSKVEAALRAALGPLAGKLHTARSRNDQVATDFRLYLRNGCDQLDAALQEAQRALLACAETHLDVVMPGFTHLQHAQPVLAAHHLLAYVWMLARDRERVADARRRINRLPLGAAALAGTQFPIDRAMVARELGFAGVLENSLDAVADRDFAVEFLAACSLTMVHLSRLCEEIILWASQEFAWIELPEGYCTGSSIMPQKKNPDGAELIRGKSGRVFGDLLGLLTALKGLPLAYNKDLQEDKEAAFDALDTTLACLRITAGMLRGITFRRDRTLAALAGEMSAATEIADYLAAKGLPFRDAHHLSGEIVRYAESRGKGLADLSPAELRRFSPLIGDDLPLRLTPQAVVAAKTSHGGTAPERVREQLARARAEVG